MDNLEPHAQVDCVNELWMKGQYDRLTASETTGYCLVSIGLKNFAAYALSLGADRGEAAIVRCYHLLSALLKEDEYIVRTYTWHFLLLVRCDATEEALHPCASRFHFEIRDTMEREYGRKLYLSMGFYPMTLPSVDFYRACYFADFCRFFLHRQYTESNYDMYNISCKDQAEAFRHLDHLYQAALERGDFKLYLQPKVDTTTGAVVGAEALMRWIDPQQGMIPLSSFLPNLEENGFIRDVDIYLFNQGCSFMQRWQDTYGKHTTISFNLAKAYFNSPYFIPEFTAVFSKYTLPPSSVRIELLESIVLSNIELLEPLVNAIYDFGFSCALDDFGSGFSTFDVLINTRLSELKLDRSLFKNIENQKERMIIKRIIDMAHDMDLVTVAEGIETQAYADYLREIGCDMIQGFLYYRPMPVEEFEQRFIIGDEGKGWNT